MLDIGLNWPLAERLGASSQKNSSVHKGASTEGDGNRDWTFVAIVNLKYEVHYVLQHNPDATLTESLGKAVRQKNGSGGVLKLKNKKQNDKEVP